MGPVHWLKCQISKGSHAPHSEVLPSVCSAGLSLGLDLKSAAQLGLLLPYTSTVAHNRTGRSEKVVATICLSSEKSPLELCSLAMGP